MKPKISLLSIFYNSSGRPKFIGLKTMGNHEGKLMVQVELDGSIIESVRCRS